MSTPVFRRQLLLSTALAASALTGYGRRAYGACVNTVGSTFECSGAETTQQNILNIDNATVLTVPPGFSVNTADPIAVQITGDGALSYTDVNASALAASTTALSIRSGAGNPGSVTVNTNGVLIG